MADVNAGMGQMPGGQQPNIKVEDAKAKFETYVNAVSANITTNEVTLQLGVTKPAQQNDNSVTVSIVGDVYMTHQTAYSMVNLLQNALKSYEERVKQVQQQPQQAAQAPVGQNIPNEGMAQ